MAQKSFNEWSKLSEPKRTVDELQKRLDFDFFKILEGMTIARSRKHIEKYYNISELGPFPKRLPPISLTPAMSDLDNTPTYTELCELLNKLNLEVYTPSRHIHPSKLPKYELKGNQIGITLEGRENGLRRFVCVNLLKRLESSIDAFRLSLERILSHIENQLETIQAFESGTPVLRQRTAADELADIEAQLDDDDQNADLFFVGGKHSQIDLADMDYLSWIPQLKSDTQILKTLLNLIKPIDSDHDEKLETLKRTIIEKIHNPINPGNKKVLIFTAFADTANYLYKHLHQFLKIKCGLETAMITGKNDSKTTIHSVHTGDMNEILTLFSPISKMKDSLMNNDPREFDVLIATDCISEGQNLQDCDYLVNYDIHWNPVRIIQRFGRIDRIGSRNDSIQMVSFWPEMELDEYIRLKERVESKMSAAVMSGAGDGNPLTAENENDLEYRKKQLERLQKEVVDLEEMSVGLSIVDSGFNEFRIDVDSYLKTHPNMNQIPKGIHAVTYGEKPGVIWVLKNRNQKIDKENRNQIHPYYIIFVGNDEEIICDHLHPRQALEQFRLLAAGKKTPDQEACRLFNKKTENGRKMTAISKLLKASVKSIINVSEEDAINSLFYSGETHFLDSAISGLDDFELIAFMAVLPK